MYCNSDKRKENKILSTFSRYYLVKRSTHGLKHMQSLHKIAHVKPFKNVNDYKETLILGNTRLNVRSIGNVVTCQQFQSFASY